MDIAGIRAFDGQKEKKKKKYKILSHQMAVRLNKNQFPLGILEDITLVNECDCSWKIYPL